ncbi:hypothetical protein BDV24DRAFT_33466 [Aspergillus arachidicola]|uniref:Uncharacterized protein n=1 Tax=Aspergillus arachidicola TaxID=656916 RepID=A0A5N6YCD3_9EURO|nr:hypothetical protein BDV24DRAFT_33466 [Aspergillus arachidicola]
MEARSLMVKTNICVNVSHNSWCCIWTTRPEREAWIPDGMDQSGSSTLGLSGFLVLVLRYHRASRASFGLRSRRNRHIHFVLCTVFAAHLCQDNDTPG